MNLTHCSFLRRDLEKIMDSNDDLSIEYGFLPKSNVINRIHISNITKIEDYYSITESVQRLLHDLNLKRIVD